MMKNSKRLGKRVEELSDLKYCAQAEKSAMTCGVDEAPDIGWRRLPSPFILKSLMGRLLQHEILLLV